MQIFRTLARHRLTKIRRMRKADFEQPPNGFISMTVAKSAEPFLLRVTHVVILQPVPCSSDSSMKQSGSRRSRRVRGQGRCQGIEMEMVDIFHRMSQRPGPKSRLILSWRLRICFHCHFIFAILANFRGFVIDCLSTQPQIPQRLFCINV